MCMLSLVRKTQTVHHIHHCQAIDKSIFNEASSNPICILVNINVLLDIFGRVIWMTITICWLIQLYSNLVAYKQPTSWQSISLKETKSNNEIVKNRRIRAKHHHLKVFPVVNIHNYSLSPSLQYVLPRTIFSKLGGTKLLHTGLPTATASVNCHAI